MADKNLTEITQGTVPAASADLILVKQGANSRKLNAGNIRDMGADLSTQAATAYTAVAEDRGRWIRFTNVAPVVFTINNSIHVAGDEITLEQSAAGVVTVTAGAGVTINSRGALIATNGQYAVATLKCITASTFVLVGDLA